MNTSFRFECVTNFFKSDGIEFSVVRDPEEPRVKDMQIYKEITGDMDKHKFYSLPKYVQINEDYLKQILNGQSEMSQYNPLDEAPNLYTELAKIKYFDIDSLSKFVKNYSIPLGEKLFSKDDYKVLTYKMDLFKFYQELYDFKKALNIYTALQSNDEIKIAQYSEEYIHYIEKEAKPIFKEAFLKQIELSHNEIMQRAKESGLDKTDVFLDYLQNNVDIDISSGIIDKWHKIKDESPEIKTKNYLTDLINNWERGKTIYAVVANQIRPGVSFKNLFEVAYYQLCQAITGNTELRECKNCGNLFEVDDDRRNFCPPLPGRKISSCQNTFNQRMKRKRKKHQS